MAAIVECNTIKGERERYLKDMATKGSGGQTKRSPERVALLQIAPETTATTRVWDKRGGAREQKKTTPVESYQTY